MNKFLKQLSLLFILLLATQSTVFAQAPGGVTTGLVNWFKADSGVSSNINTQGNVWTAANGGPSASNAPVAGNNPTFNGTTNLINYNPNVAFNGGQELRVSTNIRTDAMGDLTFYVMSQGTVGMLGNDDGNADRFLKYNGVAGNNAEVAIDPAIDALFPNLFEVNYVATSNTAATSFVSTNNRTRQSFTEQNSNGGDNYYDIGDISQGSPFTGRIGEVILYNNSHSAADRLRINSYLALKYGITLNPGIAQDYVAANGSTILWTGNATYQNNIAGIARDDASGLLQKQSASVNTGVQPVISLGTLAGTNASNASTAASFGANATALVWGSDTGVTTFSSAFNFHALSNRMTRIWNVKETGTLGVVKVYIPQSAFFVNLVRPSLLVSNDATFDGSDTKIDMTAVTINGIAYYTADVNFTANSNQFFTFGAFATAPGGISTGLVNWYKANSGLSFNISTDGAANGWVSANGGPDASNQGATNRNPTFNSTTNLINFNPNLSFSGAQELRVARNINPDFINDITFYVMAQGSGGIVGNDNGSFDRYLKSNGVSGNGVEVLLSPPVFTGLPYLFEVNFLASSNSAVSSFVSSNSSTPRQSFSEGNSIGGESFYDIGDIGTGSSFTGRIGEVILYNNTQTADELLRINSYLALKYGITLRPGVALNYVASNNTTIFWTGNATYQNNIAGIVRDDNSALLQKQSGSTSTGVQPVMSLGTLQTTNAANGNTSLTDLSAMVWGSNSADTNLSPVDFLGLNARMNRIWTIAETGTVGNVNVYMPTAGLSSGSINPTLLVSNNDTFDGSDTAVAMTRTTIGGVSYFVATGVNFTNGQFFTFGAFLTAPGGVSVGLQIWLKANTATTATSMENQAGGGGTLTSIGTGTTFNANAVNYNPALNFSGAGSMEGNFASTTSFPTGGANGLTAFIINRRATSGGTSSTFFSMTPSAGTFSTSNRAFYATTTLSTSANAGTYEPDGDFGTRNFTNATTSGNFDVFAVKFSPINAQVGTYTSNINGFTTTPSNGPNPTDTYAGGRERVRLGGRVDNGTNVFYAGLGAEAIVYNVSLSVNEERRVSSYLALKYGKTLGNNSNLVNYVASNGSTIYWTGDTTYQNNIAGIVRDDASALLQKQSSSINTGLQPVVSLGNLAANNIANASTIATDRTALMWGSNTLATTFGTWTYNIGGTVLDRIMARVWKVSTTGAVGEVQVYADRQFLSTLTNDDYHLVVSNTAAFTPASTTIYSMSQRTVNGIIYFKTDAPVTFTNGQFYTFAAVSPTPGGVQGNRLWIRPDKGVEYYAGSATNVQQVRNLSGNNEIFVPSDTSPETNIRTSENFTNFNPIFIMTDAALQNSGSVMGMPTATGFDAFSVFKSRGNNTSYDFYVGNVDPGDNNSTQLIGFTTTDTPQNRSLAFGLGNFESFRRIVNIDPSENQVALSLTNFSINPAGSPFGYTRDRTSGWINGRQLSAATTPALTSVDSNNTYAHATSSNDDWTIVGGRRNSTLLGSNTLENNSDYAEMLAWPRVLTADERLRVHSYLAIKFGFTLGLPTAPDALNYLDSNSNIVWTGTAAYQYRVYGLAKDKKQSLLQKVSRSEQKPSAAQPTNFRLTMANKSDFTTSNLSDTREEEFVNDRAFVMMGDNDAALTTSTYDSAACPALGAGFLIMPRRYRVQQTRVEGTEDYFVYVPTALIPLKSELKLLVGDSVDGSGNIIGNTYVVDGVNASGGFAFNVNFQNGVRFFAILGKIAPACVTCVGGSVTVTQGSSVWNSAAQSGNTTAWFGIGNPGSGVMEAKHTIAYSVANEPLPNSNPSNETIGGRNWTRITRRDNTGLNSNATVTYTTDLRSQTGGAVISARPRFTVRGLSQQQSKEVRLRVVGLDCNGAIVLPRYSYENALGRHVTLTNPATNTYPAIGYRIGAANDSRSGVVITFDKPVSKIQVLFKENRVRTNIGTTNYYISPITLSCEAPVNPLPDKVNLTQTFEKDTEVSCNEAVMVLKFNNQNCGNKSIDLTNTLPPSQINYVSNSFDLDNNLATANPTFTSVLSGTTMTLSNFVIPSGISELKVKVSHAVNENISYVTQSTYTVVGGTNIPFPYLSDGIESEAGFQKTTINFTENVALPMPDISLTADKSDGCGIINYTVTFDNQSGVDVSGLNFATQLDENGGQLLTVLASNLFGGTYDGTAPTVGVDGNFAINDMTIPAGISTMTFSTNATLFARELFNKVTLTNPVDECSTGGFREATFLPIPCATCAGGIQYLNSNRVWTSSVDRNANSKTNVTLSGTAPDSGALFADVNVTYPSGVEYKAGSYPRRYGNWTQLSRRDRLNGEPGKVTYKVDIKDSKEAMGAKPSFDIRGITKRSGQAERVTVYGLDCKGEIILPVILKGPGTAIQRRYTIDGNVVTGTKSNRDFDNFSTVKVVFEKEVSSVVIDWDVVRSRSKRVTNYLYVGNMKMTCQNSLVTYPDDMNIVATFDEVTSPTCEDVGLTLNIKNRRCVARTLTTLNNVLPAGLEYVPDSYSGVGSEVPTTLSGSIFSLANLTVQPGDSYITLRVRPTTAAIGTTATYSTFYAFTVTGGVNTPNPYNSETPLTKVDDTGTVINFATSINYVASTPLAKPVVTKSVNTCFSKSANTVLTYTVTIQNTTGTAMTDLEFTELLDGAQTYVVGSLTRTGFSANGTLTADADPDNSNRVNELTIDAMAVAAGSTGTITFQVNSNSLEMDSADFEVDGADTFITNEVTVVRGDLECASSGTTTSNLLRVLRCTFCTKNPSVSPATEFGDVGITTQTKRAAWPGDVPNAFLVLESKNKGFVLTRLSSAERNALTPVLGMLIYNTDSNRFEVYNGTTWRPLERGCNE